jgi:hypothetical protein
VGLQAIHGNQLFCCYIQETELHNPESVTAEAAWILWLPVTCKPRQIDRYMEFTTINQMAKKKQHPKFI